MQNVGITSDPAKDIDVINLNEPEFVINSQISHSYGSHVSESLGIGQSSLLNNDDGDGFGMSLNFDTNDDNNNNNSKKMMNLT